MLYAGCPSCEANRKHVTFWNHAGCGYKTCICYDDIHVFCSGCNTSEIIFKWNFSCQSHGFRKVQLQGILYSFSVLATQYGTYNQIQKALALALNESRYYLWTNQLRIQVMLINEINKQDNQDLILFGMINKYL